MKFSEFLEDRLEKSGISVDELRELMVRMLNYGVLCRNENQTERELYDRFLRVEDLFGELLTLFNVTLHHDRRFEFVRLYPPGARTPGMEAAEEQAFSGSLRARLSQQEVALLLVLRVQYDRAVREGKVDEHGFVSESIEALGIAMKNLLGRALPEKLTERKRLFVRLKQLRLIDFSHEDELENAEAWISIHPMVVDFVSADAVAALREGAVKTAAVEDTWDELADDEESETESVDEEANHVS
ncbi:MAG TPA: DUF4194 domain-containing protein [Pseudomonadales bacterium]|nr:DUF4194 domain-containing protein [Pseudomonadales bacterium]